MPYCRHCHTFDHATEDCAAYNSWAQRLGGYLSDVKEKDDVKINDGVLKEDEQNNVKDDNNQKDMASSKGNINETQDNTLTDNIQSVINVVVDSVINVVSETQSGSEEVSMEASASNAGKRVNENEEHKQVKKKKGSNGYEGDTDEVDDGDDKLVIDDSGSSLATFVEDEMGRGFWMEKTPDFT